MELIGSFIYLCVAIAIGLLPILFAAWAFSRAFQVKSYLLLLKEIKKQLERLNDYNEAKE
ncbi:MAG: hypothetical protein ACETWQ_22530 [Phycisphaerae bacterium]